MSRGSGAPNDKRALRELASLRGVQLRYTSNDGRGIDADDGALVAILAALGEHIENPSDAPRALDAARAASSAQILEPVIVHRPGRPCDAVLTSPRRLELDQVRLTLRLEDGTHTRWLLSDHPTVALGPDNEQQVSVRHRFRAAPGKIPPGYHTLEVEGPGLSTTALVIAAPSRCPEPERGWGSFIPLHALRRQSGDWGVGSFRDLRDLGEWTASKGGTFVGTLPVLAPFVDPASGYTGPYQPVSKLAWNEAYVDVDALPELKGDDRWAASAREIIASYEASEHRASDRADIAAVLKLKHPVLELLARSVYEGSSTRRDLFEAFVDSKPALRPYARFMAACESIRKPWQTWSCQGRHKVPESSADASAVRYHLYSQWAADRQLAEVRAHGLYLDMPIGVHPSGFDTWWEPESFVSHVSGGAPPDVFFESGQTWGFPPLHPEQIRLHGYSYVIEYLRQVMAHASIVRVDHVMGLDRLYWVPDGFDARHGAYVKYHADEMHALVVLEASRSDTVVVGEDLGTVPSNVRRAMARDGMLSSFVMEFESTTDAPLPEPKKRCLASFATHDLPTFNAYWHGSDIDERRMTGQIAQAEAETAHKARSQWRDATVAALENESGSDPILAGEASGPATSVEAALEGILVHLASSPASVVLVDLEDLWLENDQQNRPGTGPEKQNFTRRAALTFEEMTVDPYVNEVAVSLTKAREASGVS